MSINYKKLAEDNDIHGKLYKRIAEINALREGNIPKAELLSGKELASRPSPIEIYEKQARAEHKLLPLIHAIQDIQPPDIIVQQPAIPALPAPAAEPELLYGNLDAGMDRDILELYSQDPRVLDKYQLPELYLPSELITKYQPDQLQEYQTTIGLLLKDIGRQKGAATRQKDNEKYKLLSEHIDALHAYNARIKSILGNREVLGFGKIQYGKYVIDKKKLGKGILSISYPNGKKVNKYPNVKVSDGVKKTLLNNKINKTYNLSDSEKGFLRNFFDQSEAEVSKSKKKAVCNKTWDRMAVLLGELKAGNTSHVVKNELADIAHHFYKTNELNKPEYSKILSLI